MKAEKPDMYDLGLNYWCVKGALCGEIYMNADRVEINDHGDLRMVTDRFDGSDCSDGGGRETIMLALAGGNWTSVFYASPRDGSALAVSHWDGETVEEGPRR